MALSRGKPVITILLTPCDSTFIARGLCEDQTIFKDRVFPSLDDVHRFAENRLRRQYRVVINMPPVQ